jgi:hypothetical protein
MNTRRLLLSFVLAMMVLFAGSSKASSVGSPCTDFCYNEYRNCMIDCNGSPLCQQFCRDELYCCIENCNGEECDLETK